MEIFILDSDELGYQSLITKGEKVNVEVLKELITRENVILDSNDNIETCIISDSKSGERIVVTIEHNKMREMVYSSSYYKEVKSELESIMNLSGELVTIANREGVIERVSANCKEMMGIEVDEFIGKSIFELEKTGIISLSSTKQVMQTLKEVSVTQKTSGDRRLYVQGFPIFNEDGSLEKILNISRDVTEESFLREKLKEAEKVVEQLLEEINKEEKYLNKIVMKSKVIEETYHLIKKIAKTDATVLFLGETGVGKGVFAKQLHEASERKEHPFINVNCSALPESLVESELFGYGKGAFTGASNQGKKGLIEAANNGTLFLDEIGELPLNVQAKLLHVLQDQNFTSIGKNTPTQVNVRFIAATNRNLEYMVKDGEFRSDLYYRLNVVPVQIPALRERRDDIPFLIQHFLDVYNSQYRRLCKLSSEAIDQLVNYDWPGNIRELQNTMERLVITTSDDLIVMNNLPSPTMNFFDSNNPDIKETMTLKEKMYSYERQILIKSAKKFNTLKEMSDYLKIDISTISRKLKRYDISLQNYK